VSERAPENHSNNNPPEQWQVSLKLQVGKGGRRCLEFVTALSPLPASENRLSYEEVPRIIETPVGIARPGLSRARAMMR